MLLVAAFLLLHSTPEQTIDRLMAVVGGEPIFLSDVRDARALRLLEPDGALAAFPALPDGAPDADVLERLINRRLVLAEVARYRPPPPAAADVDRALEIWTSRFGGVSERDAAIAAAAATLEVARAFIADTLRIDAYIDQRFRAAAEPAREDARAGVAEERRLARVRDWLAGLRSRAQVRVVPHTTPPPPA